MSLLSVGIGVEIAISPAFTSSEHSMRMGLGELIFCQILPKKTEHTALNTSERGKI